MSTRVIILEFREHRDDGTQDNTVMGVFSDILKIPDAIREFEENRGFFVTTVEEVDNTGWLGYDTTFWDVQGNIMPEVG
jgi:hypothetical protein